MSCQFLGATFSRCFVNLSFFQIPLWNSQIHTLTVSHGVEHILEAPIVLIHGFAGGSALWATVMDCLASHRIVHAFDLLGRQFEKIKMKT